MIKGKVHEIFSESINKLNKMICNLDTQLGVCSSINNSSIENQSKTSTESSSQINTENVPKVSKKEKVVNSSNIPNTSNKPQPKGAKEDPIISLYSECDLRVGKVVDLKNKEGSEEIYELKVDLGEKDVRNIGSGLRKYISEDEIKGKNVIVFANLKPKKLGNYLSEGMILCSYNDEGDKFELPRPGDNSKPGDSIYIEGTSPKETFLAALKDNKFKKAIALFRTDNTCNATFNGLKLETSSGNVKVNTLTNCRIS